MLLSSLVGLIAYSSFQTCDVFNPRPGAGLTWDNVSTLDNRTLHTGRLRVPLSPHAHDAADTPFFDLEIVMTTWPGVVQPEPLLNHNGGPGSSASSGTSLTGPEYKNFAVFGITQRGVRWWKPNPLATPTPMFECSAADMRLPPKQLPRSYAISDFTSCPCAFVDGTPLIGQSFAAIDPENATAVEGIFERMAERGRRCTAQSKWQLAKESTSRQFNFLEWSGTSMLAHDLDRLRAAVCAEKLNLHGYSYGTGVVATYLTKFPERVGQAVLNGNMPPTPETRVFAEGNGGAFTQAYSFLQQACALDSSYSPCANLTRAGTDAFWRALLVKMRAGELYAPTASARRFPLQIGLLAAHLQARRGPSPIFTSSPHSAFLTLRRG